MIDAHLHLWTIGAHGCTWPTAATPALHRDFALADWRAAGGADQANRVVLVQSQEEAADTRWLLATAAAEPAVVGVVGWADLLAPDAADRVAMLAADPHLVGLRPMVQDRADGWYDDTALDPALAAMAAAGLVLDALVRPRHLPALARLAARHPRLAIVLDHGGKPDPDALAGWAADVAVLAAHANCWCKLSGLVTELRPDHGKEALDAIVATLWATFGPDRLVWGSDWPVLTLAGTYRGWLAQARARIPVAHHPAVFGDNAARLYGLPPC